MNLRQKIAVAVLDILMIVELAVAMYFAHRNPDNFTLVFFKVFLSALIPTFAVGWLAIRKLRSAGA
jgi:hypothetical protein